MKVKKKLLGQHICSISTHSLRYLYRLSDVSLQHLFGICAGSLRHHFGASKGSLLYLCITSNGSLRFISGMSTLSLQQVRGISPISLRYIYRISKPILLRKPASAAPPPPPPSPKKKKKKKEKPARKGFPFAVEIFWFVAKTISRPGSQIDFIPVQNFSVYGCGCVSECGYGAVYACVRRGRLGSSGINSFYNKEIRVLGTNKLVDSSENKEKNCKSINQKQYCNLSKCQQSGTVKVFSCISVQ